MFEINARTTFPYSAICQLIVTMPDGTILAGTGTVIGQNDVVTASHVIFNAQHGGLATKIDIIPGADTSPTQIEPYGRFSGLTISNRVARWENGDNVITSEEYQYDLALVGVGTKISAYTGAMGISPTRQDFNGTLVGYPVNGTGMMAEYVTAKASGTYSYWLTDKPMTQGASGGPLFNSGNYVVGVMSGGGSADYMIVPGLFTSGTYQWLADALAANDYLLGASPPPSSGTPNPSVVSGTNFVDSLTGSSGNDTIEGRAGNDFLDGGTGIDTAVYTGAKSEYTVSRSGSYIYVTDKSASRDGSDQLTNIERLKFSDGYVALDVDGNAGQAYRLYQAAFNRTPDASGLGYQMTALDQGASLKSVAANFIASPEFQRTYGNLSDSLFVNQLYQNVLHRGPDASGLAFHTGNLSKGLTRAEVLMGFSESPENQAALIGTIQNGMVYTQ